MFDPFEIDNRFSAAGYCFVLGALNRAMASREEHGHVSGRDICIAFKDEALERFGVMARTVAEYWGFRSTADIGAAVFIADAEVISTAEGDSIEECPRALLQPWPRRKRTCQ